MECENESQRCENYSIIDEKKTKWREKEKEHKLRSLFEQWGRTFNAFHSFEPCNFPNIFHQQHKLNVENKSVFAVVILLSYAVKDNFVPTF